MYTDKEMRIVDKYSRDMYNVRAAMHRDAKKIITMWGKTQIDYSSLEVRSYIHQHTTPTLAIEIAYREEFGAGMSVRYETGTNSIYFSKGSTGNFNKTEAPRQCDIHLLMSKLIENKYKLELLLKEYTEKYLLEINKIDLEQKRIDELYPGLRAVYFESDMYKERLGQRE